MLMVDTHPGVDLEGIGGEACGRQVLWEGPMMINCFTLSSRSAFRGRTTSMHHTSQAPGNIKRPSSTRWSGLLINLSEVGGFDIITIVTDNIPHVKNSRLEWFLKGRANHSIIASVRNAYIALAGSRSFLFAVASITICRRQLCSLLILGCILSSSYQRAIRLVFQKPSPLQKKILQHEIWVSTVSLEKIQVNNDFIMT